MIPFLHHFSFREGFLLIAVHSWEFSVQLYNAVRLWNVVASVAVDHFSIWHGNPEWFFQHRGENYGERRFFNWNLLNMLEFTIGDIWSRKHDFFSEKCVKLDWTQNRILHRTGFPWCRQHFCASEVVRISPPWKKAWLIGFATQPFSTVCFGS